jgi:hypothetical protein
VSGLISVHKDIESQKKIPAIWKETLIEIVDAMKEGDYQLSRNITNVPKLSENVAMAIKRNIESYGETLVSLPEETWNTSVFQWMGGYWDVFIDLDTEEGPSDLILSVRIRETSSSSYSFAVHLVYVP